MKWLLYVFFCILCFSPSVAFSQFYTQEDIQKFQRYNPDGQKYEFVKNYLTSLHYLQKNAQRAEELEQFKAESFKEIDFFKKFLDDVTQENVNLRIARNFVKRYRQSENGFIVKVSVLFGKVCDQHIDINVEKRKYLNEVYQAHLKNQIDSMDKKLFFHRIQSLARQSREALKDLLEASLLINKILISSETDEYGEFVKLGITEKEKEKLLLKLNGFYDDIFQGELRQGQTFLQGSVVVIREMLEDYTWDTLDG